MPVESFQSSFPRASLTRREFYKWLGFGAAGNSLIASAACSVRSTQSPEHLPSPASTALLKMSLGKADVSLPPNTPVGETWRYGLAFPFQVSATQAAVFCNIKGKRGHDFEAGTDVIIFGDLSKIGPEDIFPVSRNHFEANPKSTPSGKPGIMVKYPVGGGFVPLGAKRADGSPHPHAGTGFGICEAIAWTTDADHTYNDAERYSYMEVQQYRYDGKKFEVVSTERLAHENVLPGSIINNVGITTAIPDGDDLLHAMAGVVGASNQSKSDLAKEGSGVVRWKRMNETWKPVSFVSVTGEDQSFEPTLIRDTNGSLLFCARGKNEYRTDIRIWQSYDGQQWKQMLHVTGGIAGAPVSINQARNGLPFVASNLYSVLLHPVTGRTRRPGAPVRAGGWDREKLVFFPLSEDRSSLQTPILARDVYEEFGPTPSGDTWNVDHPSAKTVRLADGKWHTVVALRVCDHGEVGRGTDPAPQTGTYLEEIFSEGESFPAWQF